MRRPFLAALRSHARPKTTSRALPPSIRRASSPSPITHTDIPSFLRYANLAGLNPTTTVFTGTLYEYTVLAALSRLPGISLTRIGGKDDAGIDLQGFWELPRLTSTNSDSTQIKIPMIVQCKFGGEKSWKGPQYVRELEGALANHPIDALGVLAGVRDMTPGMRRQMLSSRRALGFIKVTPLDGIYKAKNKALNHEEEECDGEEADVTFHLTGRGGLLQQFAWNEVANRSLGGFGITARYVPRAHSIPDVPLDDADTSDPDDPFEQEITLTWNGVPVSKAP
ncbi:hypothetical protein TWF696_007002 [Orbilia brochopaga]|uniref:Uncharacterized protein n=1 Tax=Orbilia brochopaga TaxID=3140254 RepID=A0AAV9UQH7_9PEZI